MPWNEERRRRKKAALDKEADRIKARVGARTIAIIAFFDDGQPTLVMMEGGSAPMPGRDLYSALAQLYAEKEEALRVTAPQPGIASGKPN